MKNLFWFSVGMCLSIVIALTACTPSRSLTSVQMPIVNSRDASESVFTSRKYYDLDGKSFVDETTRITRGHKAE